LPQGSPYKVQLHKPGVADYQKHVYTMSVFTATQLGAVTGPINDSSTKNHSIIIVDTKVKLDMHQSTAMY